MLLCSGYLVHLRVYMVFRGYDFSVVIRFFTWLNGFPRGYMLQRGYITSAHLYHSFAWLYRFSAWLYGFVSLYNFRVIICFFGMVK